MLGDTAVAVNPGDKRYKDKIGKKVFLPLVNRKIPVIADNLVSMEFGSGAVKVTPSSDPNDFAIAERHHLEIIKIMDGSGVINENGGVYRRQDRYEARENILRDLEKVIYYEEYIVIDPGTTPLKKKELLSEDKYNDAVEKYGSKFKAKIGAEAVRDLLKEIEHFFSIYKELEEKKTAVEGWKNREAAIMAIIGFLAVLFTFLGVNLILPGLHSYSNW
jgi:hypothetical protein